MESFVRFCCVIPLTCTQAIRSLRHCVLGYAGMSNLSW